MAKSSSRVRQARETLARPLSPTRIITISFALIILVGTLLLLLPFATREGQSTSVLNALFSSTSATCVTGLVVYDTYSHWTLFGQIVLLALIQVGGIGLVTLTTFFTIALRHKIGLSGLVLAQESVGSNSILNLRELIRLVVTMTAAVEAVGALLLMTRFLPRYGVKGVWISLFLAVSAYCNAGFDILGREAPFASLSNYAADPVVNVTIMLLILIGGLGFLVIQDLLSYRRSRRLMLHTKAVLFAAAFLTVLGAVLFFLLERGNPNTIKGMPLGEQLLASLFLSVSARTAGFNTIDLAAMQDSTKLVMCLFMFIGAAPGSTGGGIKVTTFLVLAATVAATLRGRTEATVLRRRIPQPVVYRALTTSILALLVCTATASVIVGTQDGGVVDAVFEGVSAFATVGCTAGLTTGLGVLSRVAVILTMFIGRVGPSSFLLALTLRQSGRTHSTVLPEGQIIVG